MYELAHNPEALLARWLKLSTEQNLLVHTLEVAGDGTPVIALERPAVGEGETYYFSAGVHGDEPAGAVALLLWAEERLAAGGNAGLLFLPCVNPGGLWLNRRADVSGEDLNRRFDSEDLPLMVAWRKLIAGKRFARAVCLHEDYDSTGIYLYDLDAARSGEDLMAAAERLIPRNESEVIDGQAFSHGVMLRQEGEEFEVPARIGGWPEALWLFVHHCPRVLTFETPSEFDLALRVETQRSFLDTVFPAL